MAVKKTTKKSSKKSNVSRSAQLTQFKFKWWMAVALIGVIAVIGVVIVRFSYASDVNHTYRLDAPSFRHTDTVWQHGVDLPGLGGGVKSHSIYTMQSAAYQYRQVYGPYLNLPYSKYIDVCWLVNTSRYDTRVTFDVSAWEGQVILGAHNNVTLNGNYVNKTLPGFGYPGYCVQNIPLGNYKDGVEFRFNVLYGDLNFNGVTYRQHN